MIAHIMQALIVFILIAFPFAINFDDISLDNHSLNSTAVVDSAIIKHYSQTGSLPERLDAETLKKLGLNAEAIKGMTYEKLEDRKFVLSYADSKDKVKESIHSNTLLPVSNNTNFGVVEDKTKFYWIEVPQSPNQKVTVDVVYPDGSTIVLEEGERKECPADSKFVVNIVPDEGYISGSANIPSGNIIRDIELVVSEAKVMTFNLEVGNSSTQNVIVDVNDIKNNKRFELHNGEKVTVAYGTQFSLKTIKPLNGYVAGIVEPASGIVKDNTFIKIVEGNRQQYTVSVADTAHQTVTVTIKGSDGKTYTITNGQSVKVPYGSTLTANVVADKGYTAGALNISNSTVIGDVVVRADEAKQDVGLLPVNDTCIFQEDTAKADSHYYSEHVLSGRGTNTVCFRVPNGVNVLKLKAYIDFTNDYYEHASYISARCKESNKMWINDEIPEDYSKSRPFITYVGVTPGKEYTIHYVVDVREHPFDEFFEVSYSQAINNQKPNVFDY